MMLYSFISEGLPWDKKYFRLFISHLAVHKSVAEELQSSLIQFNISAFVAHKDIRPTSKWEQEIISRLQSCDALIALLHPEFHESEWTDQEIGFLLGLDKLTISINYGLVPYGFLAKYQALPGKGKTASQLSREIFTILRDNKLTRRRISEVIVNMFINSNSFEEAKRNMSLIEELDYWNNSLSNLSLTGLDENDQIKKAWNIFERLHAYIENWESRPSF